MTISKQQFIFAMVLAVAAFFTANAMGQVEILNVSYDPTRELYEDYNKAFAAHWKEAKGEEVTVEQSHGGAGKQARAVIDGLEADVVTLALSYDIDQIAKTGLLPADWQSKLPNNSTPYTSTIVFLVRKGNPKDIKDWGDLAKDGVEVITPNPKTSGGARYNHLAAWGWKLKQELGDLAKVNDPAAAAEVAAANEKAKEFVAQIYANVPVLDTGARGSTTTFLQRGIGDVLITWENEGFLAQKELGAGDIEVIVPPFSILAEPPVAVVERNAKRKKTTEVATAYLQYLYEPAGQKIAAKHGYRPIHPESVDAAELAKFPQIELFKIDDVFGGWTKAQPEHFGDGGFFDQIYKPTGR